ncbi:MAG: LutB/LldF family L-lactate oxidation iron-sulfur protein [Verrucomicrobiales bacterium]
MSAQSIDRFAQALSAGRRDSVYSSSAASAQKARQVLGQDFENPEALRALAARIKTHTLEHLDRYLEQAVDSMRGHGVQVHFAPTGEDARGVILEILRERGASRVVKAKSMATEEIHLNSHLEEGGIECLETDLGEFILQIDGDTPSHIVRPITHKNRREIARSFEKHGLGAYDDDPETITRRARKHLRGKYMESDAGITGGNFISAESGRLVLVTKEGNARFSMAPNALHIALVGIEKIVPRDRDLGVFLNLLARSATGQQLSVYTQFISGPRARGQPSGPEEMHVVLLDGGRSEILASPCREILRCIRCGACQNVCPVYRQASGHAYHAVYGGPVGAVLSPLLAGDRFREFADLPKASSLCGACREVCPVDIPIPDLLLRLRDRANREKVKNPGSPPMGPFAVLASSPVLWRAAIKASRAMNHLPHDLLPLKPLREWLKLRTLPRARGGEFREWMKEREKS